MRNTIATFVCLSCVGNGSRLTPAPDESPVPTLAKRRSPLDPLESATSQRSFDEGSEQDGVSSASTALSLLLSATRSSAFGLLHAPIASHSRGIHRQPSSRVGSINSADATPGGGDDAAMDEESLPEWLKREAQEFRQGRGELREFTLEFLQTFTFFLSIRILIIEPRYIPSLSMFPTLDINDNLAVEKVTKWTRPWERGEMIVFDPPPAYSQANGSPNKKPEALIKRIVAIEGDSIEIRDGEFYLNDVLQTESLEPYVNRAEPMGKVNLPRVAVPKDCVFVMGDNRNHSFDSRFWGWLPTGNIIGHAVFRYWPPWRVLGQEYFF